VGPDLWARKVCVGHYLVRSEGRRGSSREKDKGLLSEEKRLTPGWVIDSQITKVLLTALQFSTIF